MEIASYRLLSQQIACAGANNPEGVVSALGAMQGQDYPGTLWAIGLRLPGATLAQVEKAIADGKIVRTWPMRGTLHLVAAGDIRWMLELLSPRIISGRASRYRELGLDEKTFTRTFKVFEKALAGGKQLTREELFETLLKFRIPVDKQRGYHILSRAGQERVICFAPPRGKQDTFALLDEWVPSSKSLDRDEALVELALRYFTSRGPATVQDFAWWSGLTVSDARAGLYAVAADLVQEKKGGKTYWLPPDLPAVAENKRDFYLLPGFDEYILGYKDRDDVLDPKHAQRICPGGNGMFSPTIIVDGRVAGIWKRRFRKDGLVITPEFFEKKGKAGPAFHEAAERYGDFHGLSVSLS